MELLAGLVLEMARTRRPPTDIAARILRDVIRFHPFWDANHRAAFLTAQMLLVPFRQSIVVSKEEAEAFLRSIDGKSRTLREVEAWVKRWVRPLL